MTATVKGDLTGDVLQFFQSYARPWWARDAEGIASHYGAHLTIVRSGLPILLPSPEAVLTTTRQILAQWYPDGDGEDIATQLAYPEGRSALVHVEWGAWTVRPPVGARIARPACDYLLAKPMDHWKIVLIAVDWGPRQWQAT